MALAVKEYWDQRAGAAALNTNATTNDVYLRELEAKTLIATLREIGLQPGARVLDIGCGDGYTTLQVASALPGVRFEGIDYSPNMVASARARLAVDGAGAASASFAEGDATRLAEAFAPGTFDVIYTTRCLINLESTEAQYDAIRQIADALKPGGWYLAIENFLEGQDNLNAARCRMGLPPIPVRWHNLYFREVDFALRTSEWFASCDLREFASAYYFATRVVYSAFCKMRGEEPDYRHEIHQLSVDLPPTGQFSPVRMAMLHKADA